MVFLLKKLAIIFGFVCICLILIAYGKGYRLSLDENKITENGILAVTSNPESAKITLNRSTKGATNTNLTLPNGKYEIVLSKEGYQNWSKSINVYRDVVSRADAWLFPSNPSLIPLTSNGIQKVYASDDGQKIIFLGSSDVEISEQGFYLFQNNSSRFSYGNGRKLIIETKKLTDFSPETSAVHFSPLDDSIIVSYGKSPSNFRAYLIPTDGSANFTDVSISFDTLITSWDKTKQDRQTKLLSNLVPPLAEASLKFFKDFKLSPDANKIYYQARTSGALPKVILPELVGTNQTTQTRNLVEGNQYVYDIKEDKNYAIESKAKLLWYVSSAHLIGIEKGKSGFAVVGVRDYDDNNHLTIYSGPFVGDFVSISSDGKLIILANLNPQINSLPELYQVGIR